MVDHKGAELIPRLWDIQIVGASGGWIALVGNEREASSSGGVLQFGQTWLMTPAPNAEHQREVARLQATIRALADRLGDEAFRG